MRAGSRVAAATRTTSSHNHLLDALPASDYERLAPHLELTSMKLGDVLYEPGVRAAPRLLPDDIASSRCCT